MNIFNIEIIDQELDALWIRITFCGYSWEGEYLIGFREGA